jgi:hypothetical protein
MVDESVLERLLELLNRIDGRLKLIEFRLRRLRKGEAPDQVDEVATLLPSGIQPTCVPTNKFEPTKVTEQLVTDNAS